MKKILLVIAWLALAFHANAYHWSVNVNQYPNTMLAIGVIQIDGVEQTTTTLELGAFCGNECRGREMPMYVSQIDRYMVFLTLYGNDGDELGFRLYDHAQGQELDVTSSVSITFVTNGTSGTALSPQVFAFANNVNTYTITATANPSNGGEVSGGGTYDEGTICTLTATPNAGYTFTNWTKNGTVVSSSANYSFTVTENASYVAVFSLNSYTISASASPTAGGSVSGAGTYNHGSTCNLTATANTGYTFANWTKNGTVVSTNANYSFTVTGSGTYVANFSQNSYTISASASPSVGGSVSGGGTYNHGSSCTLTASANMGYTFTNWTKNGTVVSTNANYSFTVTGGGTYVANFSLNSYIISASANPSAGGSVSGAGTYNHGSTCTLTATANTGYTFTNWTKNGTVVSTNETYTFTVTENANYVANFEEEGATCGIIFDLYDSWGDGWNGNALTVTYNGSEYAEITLESGSSGAQTLMIEDGSHVTLTWITGNYIGECSFSVSYSNGSMIYYGANLSGSFVYEFDVDCIGTPAFTCDVVVLANSAVGGTVSGGGEYGFGSTCTVSAIANAGYTFMYWTENGQHVSSEASYSFTVTGGRNLVAVFSETNGSGLLSGTFTVGENVQVHFAKGNLLYQASTGTWRFAENQYDCMSSGNVNTSSTYSGWIDLYCWGTSGWDSGAQEYQPYATSTSNNSYLTGGSSSISLTGDYADADWAYHNAIVNGGQQSGLWRCLTHEEYIYLMESRTDASQKYAYANVNGINGLVILPDTWTLPDGLSFVSQAGSWNSNVYSAEQWIQMESAGAVFLPATGTRQGNTVFYVGGLGDYWSSTAYDESTGYSMSFFNGNVYPGDVRYRCLGTSVRPVQVIQHASFTIQTSANPTAGGTVSGAGTYNHGSTCTLTATANTGYTFDSWTENGTIVSTAAVYSFEVTDNRTLVANFADATGTGVLNGVFSVGENSQVNFSQGNLQYQASTDTWRFATNQWDCVGADNANISQTYSGWIDLFGWGTSGWNGGNTYYHPWDSNDSDGSLYGPPGQYNLTGSYANADWGVYNAICNGGNTTNQWHTLTQPEWDYVFNTRTTTSGIRYAKAKVNNVNGVILLPDDWSSSTYNLSNTNNTRASFSSNTITASQWATLENAGAVFLPAAGGRSGTLALGVGSRGNYWSASYSDSDYACGMFFGNSFLYTNNHNRYHGFTVRLVRSVQSYTQTTPLSRGWNWYSTYIEQEDIDGLGQLENSIGVPDAIIQSQYDGYVKSGLRNGVVIWRGALTSINNEEMYKIGTRKVRIATMEGEVADPANHPISIYKGWNWIGFPCSQSVSVNEALSGFTPKNGDAIKGIHSYATYSNGTWSGTLNTLEPGQGYMYGSKDRRPKTLVYQSGRSEATLANITPENNYYQPVDDYADNMTLTAVIELDGEELRSEDYELAAFVGDECRGSVKLMYVESINRYVAFLTVFGDEAEDMHFVLTDGATSDLSADYMTYATDGIVGTLDEPVVLRFGATDVNENALANVRVYPNPSKDVFNIEGVGIRKVEVTNAYGQTILSEEVENDNLQINLSGKAAGAYLLRVVTDRGVATKKLVKE